MAIGLLWGMDTNIRQYQYRSTQISTQTTATYSPTYAPQYTMGYNPQIILGSPQAVISGGQGLQPTVAPQVIAIPSTSQAANPVTQEAPMGGGNNMMDYAIAGVAIIAAVFILPKLLRKFSKGKMLK